MNILFKSHYSNIIKQENEAREPKAPMQITQAQTNFHYDSFKHFSFFPLHYTQLCTLSVFTASDNVVDQ